ncbi:hypothetical protein SAMN04488564_11392 [Lentzea waywayandensis]|uniref:Uncharacterized protein n=1 Tax=Lentzea waywayandensis TaxID=84724 RepID=A0A1I6FEB9_9PSEU|nr:hypothetical protein [Lentzea waywayandensis]SFR28244.1 hypothetical protein SAMN04488564_11392 [Lentzea waywayandensis]
MNYHYFARVNSSHPSVDEPSIVCRQWTDEEGRAHEEEYTQNLRWEACNTVHLVRSGKMDGEIHPVTEEAARRFEELQAARVRSYEPADGQYFYSLVVTSLHPVESPRALLRTWLSPQGYSMEQVWTPTAGWLKSIYMYELANDHLDGEALGIAEEEVERYKEIARQNYLGVTGGTEDR